MKILWLVNIVMPDLAIHLNRKPSVFGGWLTGAKKAVQASGHKLTICTTEANTTSAGRYEIDGITYYLTNRTDVASMQNDFHSILQREQPDVIHLYGTEFEHTWAMASITPPEKTLVSVQGLVHYYANHVYGGIPDSICRDTLIHRILRTLHRSGNSIELQRRSYLQRAPYECDVLRRVHYVNGGTAWGDGCARLLHPDVKLLQCGLILRDSFYNGPLWNYENCEKHSIFTIYTYPIKGFHKFLEALQLVVKQYPDVKVYVAGNKCLYRQLNGIKRRIMDASPDYDWYVQKLIEQYGLKNNIIFKGFLGEQEMRELLLKSNIFVSASSIENHSTALGEAMISGVPSIASCVGGLQEMIDHGQDGFLYPFNETYILADYICRLFDDPALAEQFSQKGHLHAARTYDREENCRKLLEMYETIAES